jgi:hypothetical protein
LQELAQRVRQGLQVQQRDRRSSGLERGPERAWPVQQTDRRWPARLGLEPREQPVPEL